MLVHNLPFYSVVFASPKMLFVEITICRATVYTGESLEGKMLIAFVALIIRNRMYTKLKDEEEELLEKPNYMNVPASIRELEKIEMIRQADGVYRLDHAVTATQKTILKAFGIDTNYVKRKAREISDQLNPKVRKVRI